MKKRSGKTARAGARTRVRSNSSRKRSADSPVRAVFLVGFMGAGKTSVGRALGQRLNWIFEDLDDRIERREGRTVPEIFHASGEQAFRRAEHEALQELLRDSLGLRTSGRGVVGRVIALGGGAFVQKQNATLLKKARLPTIFLDASVEELWRRCCEQASTAGANRPLLRTEEHFRKLYEERSKSYSKAFMTIQTGGREVDDIAAEIAEKLGLKRIPVRIE